MKTTDKIEERIRQFTVEINPEKDKVVKLLLAVRAEHERGLFIRRMVTRVGIVAVAAGIVVVAAVWLPGTHEKKENLPPADTVKTTAIRHPLPSEMITVMSLNRAFHNGGMDAVEKQCERAQKEAAPKSYGCITVEQSICELLDGC